MLRPKQKEQLNAAIYQYLKANFPDVADHFYNALGGLKIHFEGTAEYLEAKWHAALRLQKKLLQAQKEIENLKSKLLLYEVASKYQTHTEGLPVEPSVLSYKAHRKSITKLLFHHAFQVLISASEDGTIKVWDYEKNGTLQKTLSEHTDSVNDIDIDTSGRLLVSASSDLSLKIWNLTQYVCVRTLAGHEATVSACVFTEEGDKVISCARDSCVRIWEVHTGFCVRSLYAHTDWVRTVSVAPIPGSPIFASAGNDRKIMIWDGEHEKPFIEIIAHTHVIEKIVFAPVHVLEYLLEKRIAPQPLPTHFKPKEDLSDSEESHNWENFGLALISASRDNLIKLWDVFSSTCLQTFVGHNNWVREVDFHPSGRFIISCSDDYSIRVWDISTGICLKVLNEAHRSFITTLTLCKRNNLLASGSMDTTVKIWENRSEVT